MNYDRFDALTRTLATTTSRRTVLKTLAGSAAGGLLAMLGGRDAAAAPKCRDAGRRCKQNAQCCSGSCENGTCAPPLIQTLFECTCGDNTTPSTCNATVCNGETVTAFCQEACASSFIFEANCRSNAC